MPTDNEKLKIMKMVQEGKITAEEAITLLDALGSQARKAPAQDINPPVRSGEPGRWFRVKITDSVSGKLRTNIRLPLSLVGAGLKMGARFSPEMEGIDINAINEALRKGETGLLVDVIDDDDQEHVEIYIE
jgi:hypothetical protein